ncbi:hypothetical protein ASPZODRAFT_72466 [Penicilliopsis zonata CBS 506.65]|uniref:Inositol-pentakisphosphate 2-kinase n=1 Tax=Penicilliopsis zonata CBS 506.65 TaxID=1073090 RepID=A0A1L9SAA1_9EURO|nr:hypothetical protein ASPZODRAFT_72466 [Penicilliopsis zonata CBS 506.65]OJJ44115.1 hypothetical protein ASPZODRAFT_72466 [Penicilliopsis zonata CBS 506.65]
MIKPDVLELPVGVRLVYLAEGGANIIYRFVTDLACVPLKLHGKVLRLRKETTSAIPYRDTSRSFDRVIRPLFEPDELVDQELVRLPAGLVLRCNEHLRVAEREHQRPKKRHGVYLSATEPFGLLITDMTTFGDPTVATLAELKPKWLLQSPSAPVNARRCRTCALREMKNEEARLAGLAGQESFCPLDLVSDKFEHVLRATRFIQGCKDPMLLARVLYHNRTLLKLQSHQRAMKEVGLRGPPAHSREMSLAMTLRDCTMFIKMPHDGSIPDIRLGDLDLKTTTGGKAQYWLELEKRLVYEGWYSATHSSQIDIDSECALGRISPTS